MAHEIYINVRGKASMAYAGDTPWHGLGQQVTPGASLERWLEEAGMNFTVLGSPAQYAGPEGKILTMDNRAVLHRSDTGAALSVVGMGYKVVQPAEVMEFFRNLVDECGFVIETAGVLFKGQKYWALARTGDTARVGGRGSKDVVDAYLLLATSCDGTLMTQARFTSVCVVCHNTLTAATRGMEAKNAPVVKIPHRSTFDAAAAQKKLGIDSTWKEYVELANELADVRVDDADALRFVVDMVGDPAKPIQEQADKAKGVATVYQLYKGKGRGSELKSRRDTAWGLVNSVTEYVDYYAGESADNRMYLGQFYDGAYLKNQAFQEALNRFAPERAAA